MSLRARVWLHICQIVICFSLWHVDASPLLVRSTRPQASSLDSVGLPALSPHRKYSDPHQSAEEARVALLPQHERKRRRARKMRGQAKEWNMPPRLPACSLQMLTQARRQALVRCTIKAADVGFRKCSYRDISFPALEVGLACLGRCLLGCLLPGWRN